MIRIAFLACAETLPPENGGGAVRRGDAFEHDIEVAALRPAFDVAGFELVERDWRAPMHAFGGCAAVLLGTAWDYQDHPDAFLARLHALQERGIAVHNPPDAVRWNTDKRYLEELGENGAQVVPTLWHGDPSRTEVEQAMERFETDRVVVKRQVGAGGLGQHSFTRDALPPAGWRMGRPGMIQPFLPSVLSEGEYTFVFVDGDFSHGVRKRAAKGEYRIQSLYGGREEAWEPEARDLSQAQGVIAALPFTDLLYTRVDMIRMTDGTLAVMEAEIIEPYLYPEQGPRLGERMARALGRRMGSSG